MRLHFPEPAHHGARAVVCMVLDYAITFSHRREVRHPPLCRQLLSLSPPAVLFSWRGRRWRRRSRRGGISALLHAGCPDGSSRCLCRSRRHCPPVCRSRLLAVSLHVLQPEGGIGARPRSAPARADVRVPRVAWRRAESSGLGHSDMVTVRHCGVHSRLIPLLRILDDVVVARVVVRVRKLRPAPARRRSDNSLQSIATQLEHATLPLGLFSAVGDPAEGVRDERRRSASLAFVGVGAHAVPLPEPGHVEQLAPPTPRRPPRFRSGRPSTPAVQPNEGMQRVSRAVSAAGSRVDWAGSVAVPASHGRAAHLEGASLRPARSLDMLRLALGGSGGVTLAPRSLPPNPPAHVASLCRATQML